MTGKKDRDGDPLETWLSKFQPLAETLQLGENDLRDLLERASFEESRQSLQNIVDKLAEALETFMRAHNLVQELTQIPHQKRELDLAMIKRAMELIPDASAEQLVLLVSAFDQMGDL